LRALSLCTCCRHYPGAADGRSPRSKFTHPCQPSPIPLSGRPAHRPFRGLLGVYSRCGLHTRTVTVYRDRYPKASDTSSPPCLLRSLPAGAVAGWGLHPLEKRRLVTAHMEARHSAHVGKSFEICGEPRTRDCNTLRLPTGEGAGTLSGQRCEADRTQVVAGGAPSPPRAGVRAPSTARHSGRARPRQHCSAHCARRTRLACCQIIANGYPCPGRSRPCAARRPGTDVPRSRPGRKMQNCAP
jgi:hypothetical protein